VIGIGGAAMRLATIPNWEKFGPCEEFGVFASNFNSFRKWSVGDRLLIFIGNEGLVDTRVTGHFFNCNDVIWENDLYEWRIPIEVSKKYSSVIGSRLNRTIKNELYKSIGKSYGYLIRNHTEIQMPLAASIEKILNSI